MRFIANSEFTRGRLVDDVGVSPHRVDVKYLGVPMEVAAPRQHQRAEGVRILYLGRLIDFKGPLETIAAFERACDMGADAELIVAGAGPLLRACLRRVRVSPARARISMLGAVSGAEGAALRAGADIFTAHHQTGRSTNQTEAYGVSVVEAMSASIPVVTARSGGVCETVVDGETGVLVSPGDIEGHAQALFELAGHPARRTRLGANGLHRARAKFSIEREVARLREVLSDAISETRP